jgi:hypothetical protein
VWLSRVDEEDEMRVSDNLTKSDPHCGIRVSGNRLRPVPFILVERQVSESNDTIIRKGYRFIPLRRHDELRNDDNDDFPQDALKTCVILACVC